MKPPLRPEEEGRSSGDERQAELKSQPTITLPAARAQASTRAMTPPILAEWWVELQRRLARSELLLSLGLPDAAFDLLAEEIHQFNKACLARAASPRRATA
jgi:hypothetical protein